VGKKDKFVISYEPHTKYYKDKIKSASFPVMFTLNHTINLNPSLLKMYIECLIYFGEKQSYLKKGNPENL